MPQPTAQGFRVSAEEIQAYNDAYLSRFFSGSAVSDAASISGLTSLQALHKAIANNTVVKNKTKLAKLCRNNILRHFFRGEKDKTKLTDQQIIERLNKDFDPKSIQVAMGKLLGVLIKPELDQALLSRLEALSDFAAFTAYAQHGMDLFFEFIPLNTFIHNPGLIKLLNAARNPNAPIQDQRQILEQIIISLFAEAIYNIDTWIDQDINPRKLLVLLQTSDTKGLVEELEKYEVINIKGLQLLATIAKALIETKTSRELLDKLQKPFSDCQKEWFKQFGFDILRNGGQGSFVIDDPHNTTEPMLLTFSVIDNQVQVSKKGAKTGKAISETQVLCKIPVKENSEYHVALAIADYFKNEYKMSNELIAHLILSEHQSGFRGIILAIRGNLIQGHKTYRDKDKFSIRTMPTRSLLRFNSKGQLAAIEQDIPFELMSFIRQEVDGTWYKEGDKIKTLGTLTIKRNSFDKLGGNLPLAAYVPGVFPPFEGEVSYLSHKNDGLLTLPKQSVLTALYTSKLMLNIRQHPIKACLFFIVGCLLTALGIAAWPITAAFLSGASIAGASVAVATFITSLTTPVLAGMGAGTIGSGLLALFLSGLFIKPKAKPKVNQPVRLLQESYPPYFKDILVSMPITPTSSNAVILTKLSEPQLDELRMIIQLIKAAIAPKGEANVKDLATLATKEALLDDLKNYLRPLIASDAIPAKIMNVFDGLVELVKAHSPNINPKMPEAFISHLEALQLDGLRSMIAQMKDKLPKTPGNSPRSGSPGSSPGRENGQTVAPATPTRDPSAARRRLLESGEDVSPNADAVKAPLPGKTPVEDLRNPSPLVLT